MPDLDWFRSARLGMFVHWGHCSQQGLELSWPMVGGVPVLPMSTHTPVTVAEYESSAATFDPPADAPRAWARLARQAGMRYAVLTSRHHDGFSMWPTTHSDFHAPTDVVGAFVEACRAEGLRVGLYYSLSDWHHPDYPAMTDDDRPILHTIKYSPGTLTRSDRALARYLEMVRKFPRAHPSADFIK